MQNFLKDMTPFLYGNSISYVDVGAHTGQVFAEVLAAGFKIREAHLFEPNPVSFAALTARLAELETPKRLFRYNVALGDVKGSALMLEADTMTKIVGKVDGALPAHDVSRHFEAQLLTLDAVAEDFISKHISILKVDVEGYEEHVLRGARGLLESESIDVLYIEAGMSFEGTQQCHYRKIEDLLAPYEYQLFKVYEQKNEWIEDSPLLRRANLAFMSRGFAKSHPKRLSTELFKAQQKIASFNTSADAARERIEVLEKKLAASEGQRAKAETSIAALRGELASTVETTERKVVSLEERLVSSHSALVSIVETAQEKVVSLEERLAAELANRTQIEQGIEVLARDLGATKAALAVEREKWEALETRSARALEAVHADIGVEKDRRNRIERNLDAAAKKLDKATTALAAEGKERELLQSHLMRIVSDLDARKIGVSGRVAGALWALLRDLPGGRKNAAIAKAIQNSSLFDSQWYLTRYPEVASFAGGPLRHYIEEGAKQGYDPGPGFSTSVYLADNPDVAEAGINPLFHYVAHGKGEGREATPSARRALVSPSRKSVSKPEKRSADGARSLSKKKSSDGALAKHSSVFIDLVWTYDLESLFEECENLLARYFEEDAYLLVQIAIVFSCVKIGAFSAGVKAVDRLMARYKEERLQDLRLILGRKVFSRLMDRCAMTLTRVGQYPDGRALIDAAIAVEPQSYDLLRTRADMCWIHDPATAETDIEKCIVAGKAISSDKVLLAQIRYLRNPKTALRGIEEESDPLFLPLRANAALANDDFQKYSGAINQLFESQGLAPIISDSSTGFSFLDLLHGGETQKSGPLVTVIMTTYNSGETLQYALGSILRQTYQNLEIIVVDDVSSDGCTRQMLERFASEDSRIKVIFNEKNEGTYAAKNRAMAIAAGEYVTFHDSDDWAHPQRVATHVEYMEEKREILATRSGWLRIQSNGEFVFRRWGSRFIHPNPASLFMRKDLIQRVGYFDAIRFGADSEYWFRIHRVVGRGQATGIGKCLALGLYRQDSLTRAGAGAMDMENFSPVRSLYNYSMLSWHASTPAQELRLSAEPAVRAFWAPEEAIAGNLPKNDVKRPRSYFRFVELGSLDTPTVVFGISLISAKVAANWDRVQELLGHTLRSLLNQSDGRFSVVICGHEKPDLDEMRDHRVLFVECNQKPPAMDPNNFRRDKMYKRRMAGTLVREMGGGYVFLLDADDLVHKDFVSTVLQDDNRCGYMIANGYALDYGNRRLAPVPGVWSASFDRVCGSSAAIYFTPDDLPLKAETEESVYFNLFKSHAYWPIVAEEAGRPFKTISFPAGVYSVNNAQNLSFGLQRSGTRTDNIIAAIERNALSEGMDILRRDFGWRDEPGSV